MNVDPILSAAELVEEVRLTTATDRTRLEANQQLDESKRGALGQFMTPAPTARFMASMFELQVRDVRLLDAGAGVGSLTAALVERLVARRRRPRSICATAFEVDESLIPHLRGTLADCAGSCSDRGVEFSAHLQPLDFIATSTSPARASLFAAGARPSFNAAILNPPYRKLGSESRERILLRENGIETSNLYAAFVALAVQLLEPGGELVAITPRSFCNGPYFQAFRELLLRETSLLRVHVFGSRNQAFADDQVLQENVIFHVRKGAPRGDVTLSSSSAPGEVVSSRMVAHDSIVAPSDPRKFIHLALSEADQALADRIRSLPASLEGLGLEVSTGRVVDFRAREHLRADPCRGSAPLVYPSHFDRGYVAWPRLGGRKPNALAVTPDTKAQLVPNAVYVLTKRFSSKEEKRRIVSVVHDPSRLPAGITAVGIENHVNYFHARGSGLPLGLAKGLALYLNSTLVDEYFRQFNGHTQVNASDLRSLRYPGLDQLRDMGDRLGDLPQTQVSVDAIVEAVLR